MMRRTFFCTIVAGAFLALCSGGTTSKLAADPITQVDVAAPAGGTAQSEEEGDAMARFKERDFDGALKLLREAGKKNPDLPPPQVILADWFRRANVPAGMRTFLEQAVIEAPADPQAYVYIGELALREGRILVMASLPVVTRSPVPESGLFNNNANLLLRNGMLWVSEPARQQDMSGTGG